MQKAIQVNVQGGRALILGEVFVDDVPGRFELWVRVRALFSFVADVPVDIPAYFTSQDAETVNDAIFQWIITRYSGQRSPARRLITSSWRMWRQFKFSTRRSELIGRRLPKSLPAVLNGNIPERRAKLRQCCRAGTESAAGRPR